MKERVKVISACEISKYQSANWLQGTTDTTDTPNSSRDHPNLIGSLH